MEARESQGQSSCAVGTWHRAAFSPVTPPVPSPTSPQAGSREPPTRHLLDQDPQEPRTQL